MKTISRSVCISILVVACGACGGGGIDITIDPPPPLPEQPQVTVEGQTKQLVFSWAAITGADHYRLMENPDGHSGFTQVGDDIPAGTLTVNRDIAVHLFDWVNAQYIVEACNVTGCSSSDVATAMEVMLDTIAYIKASNTGGHDGFGEAAVALSADGNTLAVGASFEQSSATGINGNQADNSAESAGAVYVFRFDGASWAQQAYMKASNTEAGDYFGNAVALSADGNMLAVGARREDSSASGINGDQADNSAYAAGAVYLFRFDGTLWAQQAYIKASNTEVGDLFGHAVALSADGNTLAVGASWEDSGATGINGDQADNSAENAGAVYLFRSDGQTWSQQAYIKASNTGRLDLFGWAAVALSADGNTLAVGAVGEQYYVGAVYLFRFDGTSWAQQAYIKASGPVDLEGFGLTIALSADGNTLAAGASVDDSNSAAPGAVYLFRFDGTSWAQQAYIKASNEGGHDGFGWGAVALSADGNMLVVGAPGEASSATGINGDQADGSAGGAGAVYLFRFDGALWAQQAYIKASNTEAGDYFGKAVELSADGNTLAVGAAYEDSGATGIDGDQADNSAERAGAVYLY